MAGISQAKAVRNAKNAPRRLLKGISVLSDLADGGAIYGYPGDYPGRIYFVNNITGDSSFDGLSWDTPFAQVSEAITAAEAWRAAQVTGNSWIRNIIYIQGTGTSYDALTALPTCCDMIGIGADPRGDGTGIVVIKGGGDEDACTDAHSYGNYIANIQFAVSGGTSYSAMNVGVFMQSTIENCTFMGSTDSDNVNKAAWTSTSHFASTLVRNCVFGTTNGLHGFNIGFDHSGGVGNNNLFENNVFFGTVHGVKIAAGINDHGTVWKGNLMHNFLGTVQPSTAGFQMGLYSHAVANWISGATAITEAAQSQTIYNAIHSSNQLTAWQDSIG